MENYRIYGENPDPESESAERKETEILCNHRQKYRTLVDKTIEQRLSLNPFEDADAKRDLLKKVMGYNGLMSKGGKNVTLEKCPDIQVGRAFQKIYNTVLRELGSQA